MEKAPMTKQQINSSIAEITGLSGDFADDLNAMHAAEKVLRGVQLEFYESHLERDAVDDLEGYIWHATAAQRAEAFLRTLGKWTE